MTAAVREFEPGDEAAILAVIDAALPVDRVPGIAREDLVRLVDRLRSDPAATLVATDDGAIVGYCIPRVDDLTVHPAHRRRGHGRRLVEAWLPRLRDGGRSELVLHGPDRPAAAGFLAALGFVRRSSMWLFELAPGVAVPPPAFPAGVTIRTYRDDDLSRYTALAAESFADHPSPIEFNEALIRHSHGLPDFDPLGILLVFPDGDPVTPIAWTKTRHWVTEATGERRGEVNYVGVVPAWRGRGLGRELLRWGIERCRAVGCATIELSVEAANERALGLYRSTGFTAQVEWPHYALSTATGTATAG